MSKKRCFGCMLYKRNSPICEHCGYDERKTNAPHQLSPGTVLNNQYLVGKVLGQGGFGITYMGMDQFLDIPVAIKEFYPSGVVTRDTTRSQSVFLTSDKVSQRFLTNRDRFVREAISLAKLGRSSGAANIVRVQNLVQANSTAYIIMEYVDGIDMRQHMHRMGGTLTLEETLRLLLPLMESLEIVHGHHIVHRDISPDNIMVLPDGSTKLIDFGAAHEVQYDGEGGQKSTEAILKYGFAPPEQYQRKGDLGPWTDVYALCATIYYCTTGKLPPNATDRLLGSEDFQWEDIPGISPGMVTALQKGTAIRKDDRTQSMAQLHQALAEEQQKAREKHRQISNLFSAHNSQLPQVAPEAPATAVSEQPPVYTVPLRPSQTPAYTALPQEEMTPATEFLRDPELPGPTAPVEETLVLAPTVPLEETMVLAPTVPVEEIPVPEEKPEVIKEEPEATEEEPEVIEEKSIVIEEEPEVIEEEPIVIEEEPEATEEEPEATEEEPEATEEEPEATEEEPEATEEEPEVIEEEPEATEEESEATEKEPVVAAEVPETPVEEISEPEEVPEIPVEEIPEPEKVPEIPVEEISEPEEVPEIPVEEIPEPEKVPETPAEEPRLPKEAPQKIASARSRRRPLWPKLAVAIVIVAAAALLGLKFLGSQDNSGAPLPAIPAPVTWTENVLMHTYGSEAQSFGDQDAPVFRSQILNSQIQTVTFMDTLAEEPQDSWDVSEAMDGSVKAWAVPNGDLYHLYIGANGGISAGETCEKMFSSFENLQSVNFNSAFHTENTRSMASMFADCTRLTALDLTGLDTGNVTDMNHMFKNCKALENLNLMNLATGQVTDMQFMFFGCRSLRQLDLQSFDTANVTNMQNMFTGCSELTALDLSNFRTGNVSTMVAMFSGCGNLTQLDVSSFDTGHVMNMMQMFQDCGSLKQLGLSSFRTPNVTGMESMFAGCGNLTALDLGSFDTANVNNMNAMFSGCTSLTRLDVSGFRTTNVGSMVEMFYHCSSLTQLDLSSFDTTRQWGDMTSMFSGCTSLHTLDVSSFDTTNINTLYGMFHATPALTEVTMPNLRTDRITQGDAANFMDDGDSINGKPWRSVFTPNQYYEASASVPAAPSAPADWTDNVLMPTYGDLRQSNYQNTVIYGTDIRNDQIRSVTFLDSLARESGDSWDVSAGQDGSVKAWVKPHGELYDLYIAAEGGINGREACGNMFRDFTNVQKIDFGKAFHTEEATDMSHMFYNCSSLTALDLNRFSTGNVGNMESMFQKCSGLTSLDLRKFDTGKVTSMASMFVGCNAMTGLDISQFNTANVTEMQSMFRDCGSLRVLDLGSFNTAKVTDMDSMFMNCGNLIKLDLRSFNTAGVKEMVMMFSGCGSLTELDVRSFNTRSVREMGYMFYDCSSLTELDVSSFNTTQVWHMAYMFADCSSLTQLNLSNFINGACSDVSYMFSGCTSLTTVNLSNFNGGMVSKQNMFAGCSSLTNPGLSRHFSLTFGNISNMFFGTDALTGISIPDYDAQNVQNAVNFMDEGDTINGKPWKSYFTPEQYTKPGAVPEETQPIAAAASHNSDAWKDNVLMNAYNADFPLEYYETRSKYEGRSVYRSNIPGNQVRSVTFLDTLADESEDSWDVSHDKNGSVKAWAKKNGDLYDLYIAAEGGINGAKATRKMFVLFSNLEEVHFGSAFHTDEATDMYGMFGYCSNLTTLDLSSFHTAKVTDMHWMFFYCTDLVSLDLSSFDTANVTDMSGMFNGCTNLTDTNHPDFNKLIP